MKKNSKTQQALNQSKLDQSAMYNEFWDTSFEEWLPIFLKLCSTKYILNSQSTFTHFTMNPFHSIFIRALS